MVFFTSILVLQSTANLEFWETYDNTEVYPLLEAANKRLRDAKGGASTAAETDGAYNKALSTGVSIDGLACGVESGLLGFLESGRPVDKTTWFNFDRVVFRSGSAELLADSSDAHLNNLAEILKAYPDVRLKIGGYTDSTGNAAANQKLSQQRAEAVVADLEKKGVANGRLEAEGYGSQHPVASNATEEGRAKNRRMALRVLETGAVAAADSSAADSDSGEDLLQALSADSDSAAVDTAGGRAEFQKENPLFAILTPSVFGTQAGGYQLSKGTAGVRTDLSSSDFVVNGSMNVSLASAVKVVSQGDDTDVAEIVNVTFGALSVPADYVTTLTFDGLTLTLTGPQTAAAVAQAFYDAQYEEAYVGTWHVNGSGPFGAGGTTVQIQANDFGTLTDLTSADFLVSVPYAPTDTSIQQGADATTEQVELAFTGSYSGATGTIDGVTATAGTAGGTGFDSLQFQVGDGTDFSTAAYTLLVNGPDTTLSLVASPLTTTAASVWADVYTAAALHGFDSSPVKVVVETTAGHIKLGGITGLTRLEGAGDLTDGTATRLVFEGSLADVNAALATLDLNRETAPEATVTISAVARSNSP